LKALKFRESLANGNLCYKTSDKAGFSKRTQRRCGGDESAGCVQSKIWPAWIGLGHRNGAEHSPFAGRDPRRM